MSLEYAERQKDLVLTEESKLAKLSETATLLRTPRKFCKDPTTIYNQMFKSHEGPEHTYGNFARYSRRVPFHHLKLEMSLLLGSCGSKMVVRSWERGKLRAQETDPEKLKPALLKLFATAARVAAPRGLGRPLKTLISTFERDYFPVHSRGPAEERTTHLHRFQLLATIQEGEGVALLESVLNQRSHDLDFVRSVPTRPSQAIGEEQTRNRREFLFENAFRARNWTEAYRQGRLLTLGGSGLVSKTFQRRYREVLQRTLLQSDLPQTKKKQIHIDLAALSYNRSADPVSLSALSGSLLFATPGSCRVGEREQLLVRTLNSSDPRWAPSFRQLFRQLPQVDSWIAHLGKVWQSEIETRPLCRLLFSLVRFSRRRTEETLRDHVWLARGQKVEPLLLKSRLQRTLEEVEQWESLLGDSPVSTPKFETGARVQLSPALWQHLVVCSSQLGRVPPAQVRLSPISELARLVDLPQGLTLLVSPTLLALGQPEIRFILARALFRHFTRLHQLELGWRGLHRLPALRDAAVGHLKRVGLSELPEAKRLESRPPNSASREELAIDLEELHWATGDEAFRNLARVATRRCWFLRGENEANRFAQQFCDLVTASYGLVNASLACQPLYRNCESLGLGSLPGTLREDPWLVLALQNLWVNEFEVQSLGIATS